MAAPSFYSNWPSFHHNSTVPPLPELVPFHDNYTLSDTCINNGFITNNSLQFHDTINYPSLSYTYNPMITSQQQHLSTQFPDLAQSFGFTHDYYSDPVVVPDESGDNGEFFLMNPLEPMQLCNQPECYSYPSYPIVPDVCYMEQMQPELPPMPEIYNSGDSSTAMLPSYNCGQGFNVIQNEEMSVQMKENGDGCVRLSAQSMAARVRRRKISEKTSELGKLVPGGHRMTTAEMFQAAFKYVKFLQAQVGVLEHMSSSPGLGLELQGLLTSSTVQEKLYAAGKCVVSQTLAETLAADHQGTKN